MSAADRFTCLDVAGAAELDSGKTVGDEHYFRCPRHEDKHPSLKINAAKDVWLCGPCGADGTAWQLAAFTADIDASDKEATTAWCQQHGLMNNGANGAGPRRRVIETYDYTNEDGELLYQVLRYEPKGPFPQQRPDGSGGWRRGLGDVRRVLYRLPEIQGAEVVFISEGEKDVDNLAALGLTATCNFGGTGGWKAEYADSLQAHQLVVLLPHNDDPGRAHMRKVAGDLHGRVASVKMLELPGLAPKGDVSDFIADQVAEEADAALTLLALAEGAEQWEPTAEEEAPAEAAELWSRYSHDALALDLGETMEARYVAQWARWFFWDDCRWHADDTLAHLTWSRVFLRNHAVALEAEAARGGAKAAEALGRQAKTLRSAHTVAQVVSMARSNPAQHASVEQWDSDDWLLGTPGGTVDLRSGELREARADDYITKITAVTPAAPGTPTPMWTEFLDRIMGRDQALVDYSKRQCGYALTGSVREHVFFFANGVGANGKSTYANTCGGIMGDYCTTIPTSMLMVSHAEAHPTEIARLRGVRLAIGQEVEVGRRWAENKIKGLTGGDRIVARFMRQDFFEFDPKFKLFVVGNHRPSLRSVDDAIRRRLHFIDFAERIPLEEQDPQLADKLREEWPAILRWMIDGCRDWQEVRLDPPPCVVDATDSYLENEDAIGSWFAERLVLDVNSWTSSANLFADWQRWAEARGEFAGTTTRLGNELRDRGLTPAKDVTAKKRGYRGVRLRMGEK